MLRSTTRNLLTASRRFGRTAPKAQHNTHRRLASARALRAIKKYHGREGVKAAMFSRFKKKR